MPPIQDIPARAKQILAKPGFIAGADATELRELISSGDVTQVVVENIDKFGHACLIGDLEDVFEQLTTEGDRPDLTRKLHPLGHTYAAMVVLGYTICIGLNDKDTDDFIKILDTLLSAGVPVDSQNILGMTALHHAAKSPGTSVFINVLLKHKATVDLQDRFGASPLLIAIWEDTIAAIPILLDAGAKLDITDGEGSSPRSMYLTHPAKVSDVVKKWLVQHKGKGAVLQGGRCSKCGKRGTSVKRCSRCMSQLYCSHECQGADWKEHKKSCQSFDKEGNLLIVKPSYTFGDSSYVSLISVVPSSFGNTKGPNPSGQFEAKVRDGKNMVLKIQVPAQGDGGMLVYNKKRTFECVLEHDKNPDAYMRIKKMVKEKGILGMKAYFAAELRSKDELAINVAGCLPESRF